jgi:hypothetical protein
LNTTGCDIVSTKDPIEAGPAPISDSPWGCLSNTSEVPEPDPDPPATVKYTVPLVDWVTDEAPPGLKISICNRIDPTCGDTGGGTPWGVINPPPTREVSFDIPTRFEVFMRLEAPDFVPALFYFDGPVTRPQTAGKIQLLKLSVVIGLIQQLGVMPAMNTGFVSLRSHDCQGNVVGGTKFDINQMGVVPYTLRNGAPTLENLPTDAAGLAGFINVTPGPHVSEGTVAATTQPFRTVNYDVRANWFSLVEARAGRDSL